VNFFYIYKALAHPENDGYVQPFTLAERLMHVKEARRTLGSQIPWICDGLDNSIKHALGDAPNSEFIIDADGKVVRRRQWSSPHELRRNLAELIGPIDNPTQVSDLKLQTEPPPRVAARGVAPRVDRPKGASALRIEPDLSMDGDKQPAPFYAKLRAEADSNLLRSGHGRLYVGFHLDPLYHVHWNNLVKPIHVEIEAGESGVTPSTWDGPKIKEPSDIDPREFLADVEVGEKRDPLRVTVKYFACSDEQGFCFAVTQRYTVHLDQDRDAGWVQGRGGRGSRRSDSKANDDGALLGTLIWIDSEQREVTIKDSRGEVQTIRLADDARFVRNGPSLLSDFEPGDAVRLRVENGKATGMAPR
jgi:hypothetical protein